MSAPDDIREFWSRHAPGLKWLPGSDRVPVSQERCAAVRAARYRLEPHLEELAGFTSHAGRVVLEIGCGSAPTGRASWRAGPATSAPIRAGSPSARPVRPSTSSDCQG